MEEKYGKLQLQLFFKDSAFNFFIIMEIKEERLMFGTIFVCKSSHLKTIIPLKGPGPSLYSKSVKFVGLPPSTSPDSGSPLSTHSLVSSTASAAFALELQQIN